MQSDVAVSADTSEPFLAPLWGFLDAISSTIWAILHPILTAIDPLCGPVGVFTLVGGNGQLSCGATGWGDEIAAGFYVTASLAICTLPFGLVVGFFLALAKQSDVAQLRLAGDIYTSLFRALPELLTLFIIYYGLPSLLQAAVAPLGLTETIEINPFVSGMIAIGIVFSCYCSEVLLSAFRAIPIGQYEGGFAVGLSSGLTMRLVIVPQLVRIALPGLANLWMILLKDTALVSAVGLNDILRQTFVAAKVTKNAFGFTGLACLLFLVLAVLSSVVINWIEARSKRAEAAR
jgi:polar amino acid transport system permease protein